MRYTPLSYEALNRILVQETAIQIFNTKGKSEIKVTHPGQVKTLIQSDKWACPYFLEDTQTGKKQYVLVRLKEELACLKN